MDTDKYKLTGKADYRLHDFETSTEERPSVEEITGNLLPEKVGKLKDLHLKLHAEGKRGIAVVLQALDAAGKDEAISHLFSYLNAQGLKTTNYGKPTEIEQTHDYLRRFHRGLPSRGEIAIFNRSYYEEVIAPRLHGVEHDGPVPEEMDTDDIWEKRFRQINDFEQYLHENGFYVIKFFFHMSKGEQRSRLLERMKNPDKNWEFSFNDVKERKHWDAYQKLFEEMLNKTATPHAPWIVLPADDEEFSRLIIAAEMVELLERIDPQFPEIAGEEREKLEQAIQELEEEQEE